MKKILKVGRPTKTSQQGRAILSTKWSKVFVFVFTLITIVATGKPAVGPSRIDSVVPPAASTATTTWLAAGNPHIVNGTFTVPAGDILVMEAGVQVQINPSSTFQVDGKLMGNGTAANRITITGSSGATVDVKGTTDLKFTDVRALIAPDSNGVLLFADCTFLPGGGYIFNGGILTQADGSHAPYLQFDRCVFLGDTTYNSASLYLAYVTVVLRNTTFTNGSFCSVYPGYLFVDGVSSDHSATFGLAFGSDADLFLNNISVTNATNAGLKLAGDTRNGTNVLLGPNMTLQGNEYPVHLTIAGLYSASNIPATGNRNNLIHVSESAGMGGYWPKFAIPYFNDGSPLTVGSGLRILPGVTVKMAPFSYINDIGFGDGMRAFGTKSQPITFERADPAQSWYDLHSDRTEGGRMRHTIVTGNTDGVNGGAWRLENCVFKNNGIGTSGGALISGSQYVNNATGVYGGESLNNPANPNSFVGNGTGVYYSPDARNCWWNSPNGPTTPSNPGGTGDSIGTQQTVFAPFLTSPPSYVDSPPEVVLMRPAFQHDPGSKVTLRWTSTDDVGIASHKILFSPVGNWPGSFQTVATLPGTQRSYEWTVPNIGFTTNGDDAFIKVVAVDTTGKESFDEAEIIIPTNAIAGDVQFSLTPGQTVEPGEMLASVYTTTGMDRYTPEVEFYLEDLRGETRKLTGRGRGGLPFLSTDTARFVVAFGTTTNNRKYWYSPFFKMRPNYRLGDAPPTVTLNSPLSGQAFPPNTVIPVTWSASDDEGLRSFDIMASYNNGQTWQPIVRDLPGTARNYDWQTAPGTGYPSVRVMVIAKDWRFQSTSDDGTRSPVVAVSALSQKMHGTWTGNMNLPLTGAPGVECRTGGATGDHQLLLTFASPVTVTGITQAQLTSGTGDVGTGGSSNGGTVSVNGSVVTVPLTNVANAQRITVTLNNVSNGTNTSSVSVSMDVLLGDTNGNGVVNSSDIGQTKAQIGQGVTDSNFRTDVNANGAINASDVALVKAQLGTSVSVRPEANIAAGLVGGR